MTAKSQILRHVNERKRKVTIRARLSPLEFGIPDTAFDDLSGAPQNL